MMIMMMKYLSVLLVQELVHGHTSMATDYSKELDEWASTDYYDKHVHKIQLPYAQVKETNKSFISPSPTPGPWK